MTRREEMHKRRQRGGVPLVIAAMGLGFLSEPLGVSLAAALAIAVLAALAVELWARRAPPAADEERRGRRGA